MSYQLVTGYFTPHTNLAAAPMPFRNFLKPQNNASVFSGSAELVNRAPDGDTIVVGGKKIRYLHCDTRESHFGSDGQEISQGRFADLATDENLRLLGVTDVTWSGGRKQILSFEPRNLKVRVLQSGTDKYGRVLGLPIRHDAVIDHLIKGPITPESETFRELMESTVNHALVKSGFAYATYYKGLHPIEVAIFNSALFYAQDNELGKWAKGEDETCTGFYVHTLRELEQTESKIHPVVFRRIVSYLQDHHSTFNPEGFRSHLENNPDHLRRFKERYTVDGIDQLRGTTLDDIITSEEYTLKDLFEIEKAPDRPGYIVRLKDRLSDFVRV